VRLDDGLFAPPNREDDSQGFGNAGAVVDYNRRLFGDAEPGP
jgi:hypothetical protein